MRMSTRCSLPNGHLPPLCQSQPLPNSSSLLEAKVLRLVLASLEKLLSLLSPLLVVNSQDARDSLANTSDLFQLRGARASDLSDTELRELLLQIL